MNYEDLVRAGAIVAAVALLFSDSLVALPARLLTWGRAQRPESRPQPEPEQAADGGSLEDMRTILELAARLKAQGCDEGVSLCQRLIDVMLGNSPAPAVPAHAKAKKSS